MSQEIEASRDLDVTIAERVMGATWGPSGSAAHEILRMEPHGAHNTLAVREKATGSVVQYGEGWDEEYLPSYSTDRSAALEVVDRLMAAGLRVDLCGDTDGWTVAALKGHHDLWEASAPTLPLAVCACALHPAVLDYLKSRAPLEQP